MVSWLIGWLVGWLSVCCFLVVCLFVCFLVGWLVSFRLSLVDGVSWWFVGVGWLVGWLVGELVGWLERIGYFRRGRVRRRRVGTSVLLVVHKYVF